MAFFKFTFLLEDSGWGISVVDVGVVDVGLADDTELVLTDPSPEPDWLTDLALLELCFGVKVEDLNDGLGSLSGSQGNDVLASVHQDALGFHWLSFELEIVGGVNDCAIVGILNTDIFLTFEGDRSELEEIGAETQIG